MEFLSLEGLSLGVDLPGVDEGGVRDFARLHAPLFAHTRHCPGEIPPTKRACACRHTRMAGGPPPRHPRQEPARIDELSKPEPVFGSGWGVGEASQHAKAEENEEHEEERKGGGAEEDEGPPPLEHIAPVPPHIPVVKPPHARVLRRLVPFRLAEPWAPREDGPARMQFRAVPPPIGRIVSPDTEPVACAAHLFAERLDAVLGGTGQMLDMQTRWDGSDELMRSPERFDAWFIESVASRGRYALTHALFHLQQTRCLTQLHLWDIVQSRDLSARFLRLVRLVARGNHSADVDWRAENDWWAAQDTLGARVVAPTFAWLHSFYLPPAAVDRFQQVCEDLSHAVRVKKTDNIPRWVAMQLEALYVELGRDADACVAKAHSRAQMLHILVLEWREQNQKRRPSVRARAELAATVDWMRVFLAQGCACTN